MKFNQSFHTANLKNRFSTMNPILASLMLFSIAFTSIVLLPFLLMLGLLSFITFQLFGNKILRSKAFAQSGNNHSTHRESQTQQGHFSQSNANVQRETTAPYAEMFTRAKTNQSQHTGRTFEHQAD
ncbi:MULTISPECIES: hypothetical protein [Shewanella]|uniref:Uncharacterized protein n=1 Tax=Shewanella polaris TaxID=2588449 RepID=A0A4Y5YAZ3_9GAMM|nr:hypothetical protein [Shewanella polaris]QDE29728.1 hypothetical protein FH971_01345 [Shewanella polaris]